VKVVDVGPLAARPGRPRMQGGPAAHTEQLVMGEWSLTAAAWTDRHCHEETNWVLEGELHVTCEDRHEVVGPGQVVVVPPGALARYAAPVHARMIFVYGPSGDDHAGADRRYEELPTETGGSGGT
jgi:quercetin dioxygenase-like cupin family protein